MLKRCFGLLKNNPVIVAFYAIYELILMLILLLVYPTNLNQMAYGSFDFSSYYMMMMKLLAGCGLLLLLYNLFLPGFGYMLSEAVAEGKTSARSFLDGINRFFVRFLLLTLLTIGVAFAFSIIISIILVPITIMQVMGGGSSGVGAISFFILILSLSIGILLAPFVLLCIPSIMIDDVKLFQGIKNGAKAGVKNYWKLITLMLIMYLPIISYQIIFYNQISQGTIFTPSYFILLIICGIISLFMIPILFILYKDYRMEQIKESTMFHHSNE